MAKIQDKQEAINEVGNFLVEKILEDVSQQKSPVQGEPSRWRSLSKKYRKEKGKVASPIANMELTGAMLDQLEFRPGARSLEIGIFDTTQAQKADNHNKFSAASKKTPVPPRKFIPNKKEKKTFKRDIINQVDNILEEFRNGSGEN